MTRIASHRGGTLEYGDSTFAGFSATAAMDVDEVEFDLHPTADGRIIVNHDATLDRTTDRSGVIAEMKAADVRGAIVNHAGDGFRHPLFVEELCDIFRLSKVVFRCEIKPGADGRPYADFVPRVVEALEKAGRLETTVFSSFLLESLDALRQAADRPTLWLVSPPVLTQLGSRGVVEIARQRSISEISVNIDMADASLKQRAEDAGLAFGAWAAHTAAQISKAFALDLKVFTTDRPRLAIDIRNQLAQERV
ncbi:glycerophosphodiester phosphodiesterase family protein [Martelella sp. AD-3]|mgnify:CR=1 FL=1|uniref:glycerophosphodiester phosphodiesterase family protein n=1 Tax=Martelella sp. AD-3 TaxID=686597 RepID=UPI000462F0C7|nr:glycerophosphodiester phosphodiesterase family protein [Martelella sp. AD-3]AMM83243.1 glycerophosphodiester phosphodiesterase [Martelella sp. AD-3]MAM09895.1 glycerophosphodiester phosphodiesterase [Rhizobiaceae bacterium]